MSLVPLYRAQLPQMFSCYRREGGARYSTYIAAMEPFTLLGQLCHRLQPHLRSLYHANH